MPTSLYSPDPDTSGSGSATSPPVDGGGTLLSGTPSGVTTPAPTGTGWLGEDGKFSSGWLDKLPADLRGAPALAAVDSLESLAKNYVATKAMVGKKLEMPGADATPDAVAAWKRTVGAPDKAEGYGDLKPAETPAEQWDGEAEQSLRQWALKHHLPVAAVKELVALHTGSMGRMAAAAEQQAAAWQAGEKHKLQQAWGGEYQANAQRAVAFAAQLGLTPDNPLFHSAAMVQAMCRGATLYGGEQMVAGAAAGITGLQERINDIFDQRSQSTLAREYRGELGPERQAAAQSTLQTLLHQRERAQARD